MHQRGSKAWPQKPIATNCQMKFQVASRVWAVLRKHLQCYRTAIVT